MTKSIISLITRGIAAGSIFAALAVAQAPHYTVTDLGTLPGGTFSIANNVSKDGYVVGLSTINSSPEQAVAPAPFSTLLLVSEYVLENKRYPCAYRAAFS
jgi:hypothetical protein